MGLSSTIGLVLRHTSREFDLTAGAGIIFFAAGKLPVDALNRPVKHLYFRQCAGVVVHPLGPVWLRFAAHLALLTCADIPGSTVRLPKPMNQSFELRHGQLLDGRRPGGTYTLQFRGV